MWAGPKIPIVTNVRRECTAYPVDNNLRKFNKLTAGMFPGM